MTGPTFERVEPVAPCADPDGHELVDVHRFGSVLPVRIMCRNCNRAGSVVVLAELVGGPRDGERLELPGEFVANRHPLRVPVVGGGIVTYRRGRLVDGSQPYRYAGHE